MHICIEQKFLRYGLPMVFVGSEWEGRLPPITIKRDAIRPGLPDHSSAYRGFTDHPEVVRLARLLIDGDRPFRVGPVAVAGE